MMILWPVMIVALFLVAVCLIGSLADWMIERRIQQQLKGWGR